LAYKEKNTTSVEGEIQRKKITSLNCERGCKEGGEGTPEGKKKKVNTGGRGFSGGQRIFRGDSREPYLSRGGGRRSLRSLTRATELISVREDKRVQISPPGKPK